MGERLVPLSRTKLIRRFKDLGWSGPHREQLAERFAAVDTRFADLSDRRSRDVWAFVVAIVVMTVSICGSVFLAA